MRVCYAAYICKKIQNVAFYQIYLFQSYEASRILWKQKQHFRVQKITNAERSGDSNPSSEGGETDLDQDINVQSDLLSSSGFSSSEPSDNEESKTKEEINRLQHIKRFLYFNGNTEMYDSTSDKFYSIGAIIDLLKRKFSEFVPSEYLCIDQYIVPFRRRSYLKQCKPKKPKKWRYKLIVLICANW